jgi:GTPase
MQGTRQNGDRAILIAVDFTAQRRSAVLSTAAQARDAARVRKPFLNDGEPQDTAESSDGDTSAVSSPASFDLQAGLEEFRELVVSAGGEVAAEIVQRRPKPDPAMLIGTGKVQEIAGVAASARADVVLFNHAG